MNCAAADKSFGGDSLQSPSEWSADALYHGLGIQARLMRRTSRSPSEAPTPETRIDDLLASASTGFSCRMCGSCCALDVRVTESDLTRIESRFPAQAAKVSRVREQERVGNSDLYPTLFTDPSGRIRCIFLEGNKCSVHEAKPLQCRMYPFFPIQVDSVQDLVSGCEGLVLRTSPTGRKYVVSIDQDCVGVQTSSVKPNWSDIVLLWEQNEKESGEVSH